MLITKSIRKHAIVPFVLHMLVSPTVKALL